jgi:predicted nucleic acid-binding protein
MANPKRIYWDACVWIALIQKEKIHDEKGNLIEDRYGVCRNVIAAAAIGQLEIVTSTLSLAEVFKESAVKAQGEDKVAAFFEVDYILLVNLDRAVGERARTIMMAGYSKMRPPDACHLASAALSNAEEMHTYDDKILALDGKLDKPNGTKLKICKPDPGGKPAPLLDAMAAGPTPAKLDERAPKFDEEMASIVKPSAAEKAATTDPKADDEKQPTPPTPASRRS